MMKYGTTIVLALVLGLSANVSAFTVSPAFATSRPQQLQQQERFMAAGDDDAPGALVPIKEETVEFTSGVLGGIAGLLVGGPVLALIGAAAANFVAKTEGEASDVVTAVSKSTIQIFNYLTNIDQKYELLSKAKDSLNAALEKLKQQETVDPDAIAKVEDALSTTTKKLTEINDEYDLVGGSVTALGVVGELVEKAITKAGELNAEYKLTDKAVDSLKVAVEKAKDAAANRSF
jgi:hypothetical protein